MKNDQFRKLDFSVTIQAHRKGERNTHEEHGDHTTRRAMPCLAFAHCYTGHRPTECVCPSRHASDHLRQVPEHLEYALRKHHSVVVTQWKYLDVMASAKQGTCYWLLIKAAIEHERPVEVFNLLTPWLGRYKFQFAKTHLTMAMGTEELLTLVLQQSYCPTLTSSVLADAYEHGGINTLQVFGRFGTSPLPSWDSALLGMIVRKGDVTGVRYFLAKVVELVAKRSRKSRRPQFANGYGLPMITYVVNSRAKFHCAVEMIAALREYGEPWDEGTTRAAVQAGDMQVLGYLHEHGCPWDESSTDMAAKEGNLTALQYLHERGCPWNESIATIAAQSEAVGVLKYALANNCPSHWVGYLGRADMYYWTKERRIECRDLVVKSGCFISPIVVIGMAYLNDEEGFNAIRGHVSLLGRIRPAFVEDVSHLLPGGDLNGHRFLWLDATQRLIKHDPRYDYESDIKRVVDALTSKCEVGLPYPELQLRALWLLNIPLRAVSDSSKKAYARWTIRASIRAYVTMWSVGFYLLGKSEERQNAPGSALHLNAVGDWDDLWSADAGGVVLS